jgi:hypothetical protein
MKNLEIGDNKVGISVHMLAIDKMEMVIYDKPRMVIVQLNPDEVRQLLNWLQDWLTERQE